MNNMVHESFFSFLKIFSLLYVVKFKLSSLLQTTFYWHVMSCNFFALENYCCEKERKKKAPCDGPLPYHHHMHATTQSDTVNNPSALPECSSLSLQFQNTHKTFFQLPVWACSSPYMQHLHSLFKFQSLYFCFFCTFSFLNSSITFTSDSTIIHLTLLGAFHWRVIVNLTFAHIYSYKDTQFVLNRFTSQTHTPPFMTKTHWLHQIIILQISFITIILLNYVCEKRRKKKLWNRKILTIVNIYEFEYLYIHVSI